MANDNDVTMKFGADFANATRDIDDFFSNIKRTTIGGTTGLEKLSSDLDKTSDSAEDLDGTLAALTPTMIAAGVAATAFVGAIGAIVAAFTAVKAAVSFTVESIQLAMKAEDDAYEAAVKLAEAQGRLPPVNHTLSASLKELNEVLTDAKAQLGEALLPILKDLVPVAIVLAEHLRDIAKAWAEWATSLSEDSGLSNVEDFLIRIAARVQAFMESLRNLQLQLERDKFEWDNLFTIASDDTIAKMREDFAVQQRAAHGYEETTSGRLRYNYDMAHPFGDPGRAEQIEKQLRAEVEVKRNEKKEGSGVEDAVQKNKQLLNNFFIGFTERVKVGFGEGAKEITNEVPGTIAKFISDAILTSSKEGSELYVKATDEIGKVFDQYAGIVTDAESNRWKQAKLLADPLRDKDKERDRFQSGFEDSLSTFRRIQSSQLSEDDVPKKQLTVMEKQLLALVEQKEKQDLNNIKLGQLIDAVKTGVPAVAQ